MNNTDRSADDSSTAPNESSTAPNESSTAPNESSTAPNRPVSLDDEAELDEFVSEAGTAVVEFYTEGCGICRSMEPVLGNVARELGVAVGTVNPRDDPPLVDRFDVRSVPLFVVFVDGEAVARRADGFMPGSELADWMTEHTDR